MDHMCRHTEHNSHIFTGVEVGFDNVEYNVTEGTNTFVEVCFSTQQSTFGGGLPSLVANISHTGSNTGKLRCFLTEN